jgi:hypothetical protein
VHQHKEWNLCRVINTISLTTPVLKPSENKLQLPCGFTAAVDAKKNPNSAMISLTRILFTADAGSAQATLKKIVGVLSKTT